ncbi:MAG: hypothetical protein E7077_15845 [Bacteroidales bacterium]|jgi:hypothetical protein|nr:hypothetical protein [Bacteroidales bacterium]
MGLFKGIKNLLFEEVDEHGRPIKREEKKTAPAAEPANSASAQGMPADDANSQSTSMGIDFKSDDNSEPAEIDEGVLDNIIAMLDEKNLPGPDYLELKKAANDEVLLQSIPDEKMRFTVSYATLKAASPSLSKKQILQSILTYIQYIEDERGRGIEQFNKLWQEQVVAREEAVEKAKAEIAELEAKLEKLKTFAQEQEGQVVAVKADCGKKKKEFNATVDYMIGKLRMDGAKLEEALKE